MNLFLLAKCRIPRKSSVLRMASRISLLWALPSIAERISQQKALYVLVIVFSLTGSDSCRPENPLVIGTAKSCVGHNKTMSGLISVIKTLGSFAAGTVPGPVQLQSDNMNPSIDCSVVPLHIPFETVELKKSVCDDFVSENWSICLIFFLTSPCTDQTASQDLLLELFWKLHLKNPR